MTDAVDLAVILDATPMVPVEATLPISGRTVRIGRYLRTEIRDVEPIGRAASCWAPNKPSVLVDGRRSWPEYAILRRLERGGWECRWIKNWTGGREFCLDVDRPAPLPPKAAETFALIHRQAAALRGAGSWDVFAWNQDDYLFIESKQHRSGDRLKSQPVGVARGRDRRRDRACLFRGSRVRRRTADQGHAGDRMSVAVGVALTPKAFVVELDDGIPFGATKVAH